MRWSVCAVLERLEGRCNVLGSPDFEDRRIKAERAGRGLRLSHFQCGEGIFDIGDGEMRSACAASSIRRRSAA
jgi:hypothetical protein